MTTHKAAALRDEQCCYCAYPFDEGERVVADETGSYSYCSRKCATDHTARLARIDLSRALKPDILGDIR